MTRKVTDSRARFEATAEKIGVRELARRLGISATHASDIKLGKKKPSLELAARLQREYRISAVGWYL